MDAVLRTISIYFILLFVFRAAGKRTLSEITTFDFILLLVIGESTQQALLGNDFSVTNAGIVIITLILIDIVLSFLKQSSKSVDKILEGQSLIIVENGKPLSYRMKKEKIDKEDVLEAARKWHGLERMSEIKYAVLEKNGGITIIPK